MRSFGPRYANGPLDAAWGLALFARAAELLKRGAPGGGGAAAWTPGVERRFRGFVGTLLLPNLRFYDDVRALRAALRLALRTARRRACYFGRPQEARRPVCATPPTFAHALPRPRRTRSRSQRATRWAPTGGAPYWRRGFRRARAAWGVSGVGRG